ncbi:hypothetical protein D3C76_1533620 [compost metagenome]
MKPAAPVSGHGRLIMTKIVKVLCRCSPVHKRQLAPIPVIIPSGNSNCVFTRNGPRRIISHVSVLKTKPVGSKR